MSGLWAIIALSWLFEVFHTLALQVGFRVPMNGQFGRIRTCHDVAAKRQDRARPGYSD